MGESVAWPHQFSACMNSRNSGYIQDVDELIAQTSAEQVLAHYGKPLPRSSTGEHRMQCVFSDDCSDSQYGNLTVKLDDAVNRIFCHSCRVRGNLLTLLHGLEHHQPPTGGRLRGQEFKDSVNKLREIASSPVEQQPTPTRPATVAQQAATTVSNTPLHRHEKEAARELADLCDELITDVGDMSPAAAQYIRQREWMTPELLKEWGVGWIPGNGRSLFRKNYLVFTHRNERGEVLSYSGRDLNFESKWTKWVREGRPEGKKPNKHRYVSGYHKGQELYGGQAARLSEEYVQESLQQRGVVVVEGMNEVMRMATLGVAAVGLGSNRATETQIDKLCRFAQSAGDNRIVLLPDCDDEGEAGFRDLLWKLNERRVQVQLGCTSGMFSGQFSNRQPESWTADEWAKIDRQLQQA